MKYTATVLNEHDHGTDLIAESNVHIFSEEDVLVGGLLYLHSVKMTLSGMLII